MAPFWVAGSYGTRAEARAAGAAGVQVGTAFALAEDSGLTTQRRGDLRARATTGTLAVRTDPVASPTGFPFKVAQLPGTLADAEVYGARRGLCDLSHLRTPYQTESGGVGYRCPGEPVHMYARRGRRGGHGRPLLPVPRPHRRRRAGSDPARRVDEPALVTLGSDLDGVRELAARHPDGWTGLDVVAWLTRG